MLLGLRGKEQMGTALGRRLFQTLRGQVLSRCSLTRSPIPPTIVELSRECQNYGQDPSDDLFLIATGFCQLRSERPFFPRESDSESLDREIISRCISLAARLKAWILDLAPDYFPLSILTGTSRADVLGDHYDVYRDVDTAMLLNQHRRFTILVLELTVTRLINLQRQQLLSTAEIALLRDLRQEILSSVGAVCASVPFLMEPGRIEVGISLVWALYLSAQLSPRTVALKRTTRDWMIGRLRAIGSELGLGQAYFLTDVLIRKQEVTEVLYDDQASGENDGDWRDVCTSTESENLVIRSCEAENQAQGLLQPRAVYSNQLDPAECRSLRTSCTTDMHTHPYRCKHPQT